MGKKKKKDSQKSPKYKAFLQQKEAYALRIATLRKTRENLVAKMDAAPYKSHLYFQLRWEIRMVDLDIKDLQKGLRVKWKKSNYAARIIEHSSSDDTQKSTIYRDTPDAHKRPVQGGLVSPK